MIVMISIPSQKFVTLLCLKLVLYYINDTYNDKVNFEVFPCNINKLIYYINTKTM